MTLIETEDPQASELSGPGTGRSRSPATGGAERRASTWARDAGERGGRGPLEPLDYLRVLGRYWKSALAITLLGVLGGGLVSYLTVPTYTASAWLFLSVRSGGTAGELAQGATFLENQVRSYAQVATAPIVLQPVIDRLDLGMSAAELATLVVATVPTDTAIIEITASDAQAARSAEIANAIALQMTSAVESLSQTDNDERAAVRATVIAPAVASDAWARPDLRQNLLFGGLLGLLTAVSQAFLRRVIDTRVVSEADVAAVTDSSIIGVVRFDEDAAEHPVALQANGRSARAEAYRRLRTNLRYVAFGRSNVIVTTSAIPGEGKSLTAINLAFALASAGQSVLLVDADLRRPSLSTYLGLEGEAGLTSVIIGRARLADVVQPVGMNGPTVLTSGHLPPNPAELLGSDATRALLDEAAAGYDAVIVDAPPLLPVADAAVLGGIAGGVLMVVGSGQVTRPQLARGLAALQAVGADPLGVILNRVRVESDAQRHHHSYYDYYYPRHEHDEHGHDLSRDRRGPSSGHQ